MVDDVGSYVDICGTRDATTDDDFDAGRNAFSRSFERAPKSFRVAR